MTFIAYPCAICMKTFHLDFALLALLLCVGAFAQCEGFGTERIVYMDVDGGAEPILIISLHSPLRSTSTCGPDLEVGYSLNEGDILREKCLGSDNRFQYQSNCGYETKVRSDSVLYECHHDLKICYPNFEMDGTSFPLSKIHFVDTETAHFADRCSEAIFQFLRSYQNLSCDGLASHAPDMRIVDLQWMRIRCVLLIEKMVRLFGPHATLMIITQIDFIRMSTGITEAGTAMSLLVLGSARIAELVGYMEHKYIEAKSTIHSFTSICSENGSPSGHRTYYLFNIDRNWSDDGFVSVDPERTCQVYSADVPGIVEPTHSPNMESDRSTVAGPEPNVPGIGLPSENQSERSCLEEHTAQSRKPKKKVSFGGDTIYILPRTSDDGEPTHIKLESKTGWRNEDDELFEIQF